MSDLVLRDATPDDAEQLLAFVELMAPELNIKPGEFWVKSVEQEREELERYAASENSFFLTAWKEGQLVGTLTMTGRGVAVGAPREAEHHAAQLGISIHPELRGSGVGTELLRRAIERARGEGVIRRVEIMSYATNSRARALYLRHGFEVEGCRRRAVRRNGEFVDVYVLGLLLD